MHPVEVDVVGLQASQRLLVLLYALGVPLIRSMVWNVATIGIAVILSEHGHEAVSRLCFATLPSFSPGPRGPAVVCATTAPPSIHAISRLVQQHSQPKVNAAM